MAKKSEKASLFVAATLVVGFVIFMIIVGFVAYDSIVNSKPSNRACTQEAKICPNGATVVRVGPNCEFEPCPVVQ